MPGRPFYLADFRQDQDFFWREVTKTQNTLAGSCACLMHYVSTDSLSLISVIYDPT
jgi:hypothetical protein